MSTATDQIAGLLANIQREFAAIRELLGRPGPTVPEAATAIQDCVCRHYGIEFKQLHKNSGRRELDIWPRFVAAFLLREHTTLSFHAIAETLGYKDHAGAMHACQKVRDRLDTDPKFHDLVETLQHRLKKSVPTTDHGPRTTD